LVEGCIVGIVGNNGVENKYGGRLFVGGTGTEGGSGARGAPGVNCIVGRGILVETGGWFLRFPQLR
jgi:hypothetical protein